MKVFISWRWLGVVLALIAATYIQICGSATMKELSGGLVIWRARMAEKKWARNIYSEGSKGVKYLKVTGNVTTYMDGSKVYSVQCHVDTSKEGYTSHITWVAGLLFSWHQTKDDVKKLIAGSFDIRQDTYGYQNIQWVPRTNFKNFPILQSSIDEHSAWLTLKRKTDFNKDKFVLNLPVNECEKITGVFECEIFGHPKKGGQYLHASDFFSFSDGDNSLDMKCAENKKRKTTEEIKAIADFSEKKLTLEEDHRTITEDARFETLRMGWNKKSQLKKRAKWVHVKAKLIKGKGHTVLELTGRVSEKRREQVTAITRIYMFYEPRNKGLSSVQYLVVGLVRDEAMWAEPFNLRNFPLLQRAIKDNNATGVSGSGHEAKFIVRIKYEDCETLPGKFFFEVIGTVRKAKSVIEGFYEIPNDSHLSRIPRSCLYRKPKPEKDEDKGRNGADRGKDKIDNKVDYKDKMDTFKDTYKAKVRNLGKVVSKIKTRNRDKVEVEKAKPETESSNNTLLVVAIVILCVVIVVVAGFFILKARKKQEEGEESQPILNKTDENAEDISKSDDEKKAKKKRKKKKRRDGEQKSKERKENEEPEEEKIQEEEQGKDEESKNNSNVYYQYKRSVHHRQSYAVPPDYTRSRDVLHNYTKTPSYMRYSYPQQTYRGPQNLVPATSLTQYAGTLSYDHCMAQQSARHNYVPVNDYRRPSMYVDHEVDLTQSRPVPQPTYVTPRHRVSHTRPIMSDHQYPKNFTSGVRGRHPSQHEGRTAGNPVCGQSSQQRDLIQLDTDGQKSNERKNVAASTAELADLKSTQKINEHNDKEQKPCVSEKVMDSELQGDTSLPENVDPHLLSTLVKRRLSFAPSSASTNIQDLDKNSVTSDNSKSKSATE